MKKSVFFLFVSIVILFISISWIALRAPEPPLHSVGQLDPVLVKQGRQLVTQGYITNEDGRKGEVQSKYFVCIDCHTTSKEFDDLSKDNAVDRLVYGKANKLPYLPGSSFYGIVNRVSWYNDDYLLKYGKLVESSRDTLVNAIQLCATVCSQGRALDEKEMQAVLHYFWSIAYTREDIETAKFKQVLAYRAHFSKTLPISDRKFGEGGSIENGEYIYDYSCLQCHDRKFGAAKFKLDHSKLTFRMLKRHFNDFDDKSIYQIIRHGTTPEVSNKAYMPLFTKEKMTDAQIEDLAAYILAKSK